MARRIAAGCVLFALACSAELKAEPFTILPDGQVAFDTALMTSGVFRCQGVIVCSGSGTNSVVLGSGDEQARITFNGVTTAFQVTNRAQPVGLVVTAPALLAAQALVNRNIIPEHRRFLEWIQPVKLLEGQEPVPAIADFPGERADGGESIAAPEDELASRRKHRDRKIG